VAERTGDGPPLCVIGLRIEKSLRSRGGLKFFFGGIGDGEVDVSLGQELPDWQEGDGLEGGRNHQ
jgi:hypothetical protein